MASSDDEEMLSMYGGGGATGTGSVSLKRPKEIRTKPLEQIRTKKTLISPQVGFSPAGYSPVIQSCSEKYGSRTKSGDVIFRFKCKDSSDWETEKENSSLVPVEILPPTSELANNGYKYMFQKLKEIAMALDSVLEDTGCTILERLGGEQLSTLKDQSVDECLYLGKIRSDGTDGRLTHGSVSFEGCLEYSNGHKVSLDLSALEEYHLFPGQIAVLEGINEMGKCLRVTKMYIPEPLALQPIESKLDHLSLMIAVGPYTPIDSLKYEPFEDLIRVILRDKPDICILIGPFIEATHKMIESEELDETFEELFQRQIKQLCVKIEDLNTQIILISSFKDVHGHMVYPTPPYSLKKSEEKEKSVTDPAMQKVQLLPDPATVKVGGIVIGMTSTDVLKHLSKYDLSNSTISGDRLGRLARHITSQRNFYPLYPCEESLPVDVEHLVQFSKIETAPHILILPSDLRYFIKEIDGTIVINPERLTKGFSGGTYARLQIDLSSLKEPKEITSIADYCTGEIIRI